MAVGGCVEFLAGRLRLIDLPQNVADNLSVRVCPVRQRPCGQRDGIAPHAHEGFGALDLRLTLAGSVPAAFEVVRPVSDDATWPILAGLRSGRVVDDLAKTHEGIEIAIVRLGFDQPEQVLHAGGKDVNHGLLFVLESSVVLEYAGVGFLDGVVKFK